MAYGLEALRRIQFAKETTSGTAVATTTAIWRGKGVLNDAAVIKRPPEDLGNLQPRNRSYIPQVGAEIPLEKTPLTFEQFPYIMAMGIAAGAATGTVDGTGGSDYIYTATLSTTSAQAPATYTFEVGDNTGVDEAEYVFCQEFDLDFAPNEAVMLSAKLFGRQATLSSFSATISPPTVEEVLTNKGSLYLHATTFGSGAITGSFVGGNVNVKTGFQPVYTGDGAQIYFYTVKQAAPVVTGTLVLENDTNGAAELLCARNRTTRMMRLKFVGSTQTTAGSGSAWATKTVQMDIGIRYTKVATMSVKDGDDLLNFAWELVNVTSGGVFTCVNEVSTLP